MEIKELISQGFVKPTNTKQELHRALRRAIGCFSLNNNTSRKDFPKWVLHAEKTLKSLRKEAGTHD